MGTHLYFGGSSMYARREPTPRPSNISIVEPSARGLFVNTIFGRTVEDDDDEKSDEAVSHSEGKADKNTAHSSAKSHR